MFKFIKNTKLFASLDCDGKNLLSAYDVKGHTVHYKWLFLLALAYLFIPSMLVLIYFGSWPILTMIVIGLVVLWTAAQVKLPPKFLLSSFLNTWPLLILAAIVVWLSGILPPFAENWDWNKHYAIFNTLINSSWPVKIITENGVATLRYYLSYYILPSMAAKLFGSGFLSIAIYVWTTLGLYIAMLLAFGLKARRQATALFFLGCIFLLFSGADIVGAYYNGGSKNPSMHFEWWAGFGSLDSIVTDLFWVPQHAIAGLIAAFLMFRYPYYSVRNIGVIVAAVMVWSPFCAIGIIPIFLWAILKSGYKELFTCINLIAAPALCITAAFFLLNATGEIPSNFIWNVQYFTIGGWLIFLFLEFMAISLALMIVAPQKTKLIVLQVVFLIILSLFSVGLCNDLLMRASIPSLGILAVLSSTAIVYKPNTIRKIPLIICLVVGLVTPLGEIMRSIISTRIKNHNEITIQDIIHGEKRFEPQYLLYKYSDNSVSTNALNVLDISNLSFHEYGVAHFNKKINRIYSDIFTDAAFVSNDIILPAGIYRLDAVFDWDVTSKKVKTNAGHLSLHGKKLLVPIMSSKVIDGNVQAFFQTDGKPFSISFGLGGWSFGKGFVELKQLKISFLSSENKFS